MAEPETQIEEEPIKENEFPGEVTTDTDATEDATTTDYEITEPTAKDVEEKERSWLERCVEKGWSSQEGEPFWRFIKS